MRGRRAGQLVLDTYAVARPVPQPTLPARRDKRSLLQRLVTPRVQQLGARLAVFFGPVLKIRKFVVVSHWAEVKAALENDLDFGIAPVNRPHIEAINGPFLLSLDRGPQLARERPRLYDAVSRIDLEAVRRGIAAEADHLLDGAVERGHIDAGDGYARPVAARTAVRLFGIAGPTEGDLKRVCRAMFQHAFLNIGDDAAVADRALYAAGELRGWILQEIARRRASGAAGDDVLGHLMTTRSSDGTLLDDDAVRRNLAGLLVGAIDTTSVAVLGIIATLASDRRLLARVEADLGNRERMVVWCYEALRRRPQTPLVLRRAVRDVTVGGKAVPSGALLAAFTQAAMFDPAVFPHPGRLDPSRCPRDYMHFGGGLHPCAGRDINAVQLPELVERLVSRGIERAGSVRFDGPFLDQLVVYFRRPRP
jgi:cytochrome P450